MSQSPHATSPDGTDTGPRPRRTVGAAPTAFSYDQPIVTHPRWPVWARIAILPVLMLVSTMTPVLPQLVPGFMDWARTQDPAGATMGLVGLGSLALATLSALFFVWLLSRFLDGMQLRDVGLGLNRRTLPALAIGYLAVMAITIPIGMATYSAGWGRAPDPVGNSFLVGLLFTGIAKGAIHQGFPEELYWRGYGMATLRDHPIRAVWICGVLFGAMHIVSAGGQENMVERVLYVGHAMAFAILAGALALATRSVWAAVGVHGGLHLGTYLLEYNGYGSGPAQWTIEAVLMVVVAVVIMQRWQAARARAQVHAAAVG